MFVLFVYHAYIDPAHYQSSQVLCEDLSIQLTDILHKLHTEALNLLHMELYARNKLIPGPGYIVTETMNEQLFIMVCRHFAYAGTIDKILPFRDEFESIMLETSYYNGPFTKYYTACSSLSVWDDYVLAITMTLITQT